MHARGRLVTGSLALNVSNRSGRHDCCLMGLLSDQQLLHIATLLCMTATIASEMHFNALRSLT